MRKILFMLAITFSLIFSTDAFAKFGRVGGFRSSGFRSYSYSRPSSSRHVSNSSSKVKSVSNSKSKAVSNSTKTNTVKSTSEKSNTASTKEVKSNNSDVTSSNKAVHTNTIIKETSSDGFSSAPMWFLIGHSTAQDRIHVINNTNEKFSCSDCESLKDEKDVYNACLKKCTK